MQLPHRLNTRIAPTPSGFLHIGNAFNFLLAAQLAKAADGNLRLRIDDLDAPRTRREYIEDIFETLAWLGIEPDEGPGSADEQVAVFSQSHRMPQYYLLLQKLIDGGHIFACTCSRKDLEQHHNCSLYAGTCIHKNIPLETPGASWRILTPRGSSAISFDDGLAGRQTIDLWQAQRHFVVRRRDGLPAYHIASLWDDVDYGINTIVRGQDLLGSTAVQLYLAGLAGLGSFQAVNFYHHALVEDDAGKKLSKSAGSSSLKALRDAGVGASAIRAAFTEWNEKSLPAM